MTCQRQSRCGTRLFCGITLLIISSTTLLRPVSSSLSTATRQHISRFLQQDRHEDNVTGKDIDVIIPDPFNVNRTLLTVGGFVESDECWADLDASDLDRNGQVSPDEYVFFAQSQTSVLPPDVEEYNDLPLVFRLAFSSTACLCNNPLAGGTSEDTTCCLGDVAFVRIPVAPSAGPNTTEINYLYIACSLVQEAADTYLNSAAPTTRAPTVPTAPTTAPANAPTSAPAATPIAPGTPTSAPVLAPGTPTSAPIAAPITSSAPTVAPVAVPTGTAIPTSSPSSTPVVAPPTLAPTAAPLTVSPSVAPAKGSPAPSRMPISGAGVELNSTIDYAIALSNGMNDLSEIQSEYLSNLISAMNQVASDVAAGQLRRRRRLQAATGITALLPTTIAKLQNVSCPTADAVVTDSTLCQIVGAVIDWQVANATSDTLALQSTLDDAVEAAIRDGTLQKELDDLEWSNGDVNPIVVLTGLVDVPVVGPPSASPREIEGSDSLSSGGIAGITLAGLLFLFLPISYYLYQRNRSFDDDYDDPNGPKPPYAQEYEADVEGDMGGDGEGNRSVADSSMVTDAAQGGGPVGPIVGATTLGASQAYYGKQLEPDDDEPGMLLDDADQDDDVDDEVASSNAGSSGWSSSAGISSLNTGSVDEVDIAAAAGATLAGIGLASAFSRNLSKRDGDALGATPSDTDDGHSDVPSVSRDQLDSLIEAGDWAAVGATAALLAAASDSQSGTSMSRGKTTSPRSRDSQSVDAARAAELDHLVDAGDWEGVVAAAAKFEAQAESGTASGTGSGTGSRSSRTHSSVESSAGSGSNTGTGTNTAGSPSVATSLSDTASKAQKREEIRSEVEALVRRVVPEEIDNVDEMMNQFKGREEELVETLRTMQERAVAQKARAAGHRAAKTEARRNVQRSAPPGPVVQKIASLEIKEAASGTGGVSAAGVGMTAAAAAAAGVAVAKSSSKEGSAAPKEPKVVVDARVALEDAIEAGDWEAVGEAAAMISDNSVTTASSGEIARLASANLSISTSGTNKSRGHLSGVNADRASELDALIERGDWSGVVAVANRFTESDKKDLSETTGVRSREEEEALKEAELWMKIADQKKAEGAMDAGASNAAEWAIQRSLSQLREAEKKSEKKLRGTGDNEDEV